MNIAYFKEIKVTASGKLYLGKDSAAFDGNNELEMPLSFNDVIFSSSKNLLRLSKKQKSSDIIRILIVYQIVTACVISASNTFTLATGAPLLG
ncbi:hypothetical protein T07_5046 [Trichinella nelsoni]|uniref:Uncharacterized protein n=1 Tax=Trichinella nelsoni TaxID=6336 RepID=A0A0V0RK13_9BILA|nr:hypothetical protein T07_5046 [Trichinella nelsoni]